MDISIVGAGAVGISWAKAITEAHAAKHLTLFDPCPTPEGHQWAEQNAISIHTTHAGLPHGDIVLICVPGNVLPTVIAELLPTLNVGTCLLDLSTASPSDKEVAAEKAIQQKTAYLDAAITGAVALTGAKTPLLVAGTADKRVEHLLSRLEIPTTHLDASAPGDAVKVKLLRSVITKGIEALAVEMLPVARRHGVLPQLFSVFDDIDRRPFADLVKSMVITHGTQAERRYSEMIEASEQIEDVGADATLTRAVTERFRTSRDALMAIPATPGRDPFDDVLNRVNSDLSTAPANTFH